MLSCERGSLLADKPRQDRREEMTVRHFRLSYIDYCGGREETAIRANVDTSPGARRSCTREMSHSDDSGMAKVQRGRGSCVGKKASMACSLDKMKERDCARLVRNVEKALSVGVLHYILTKPAAALQAKNFCIDA